MFFAVGHLNFSMEAPPFGEMELQHTELVIGGKWKPSHCHARAKIIIIIPFRDREEHLRIFLNHMHPILQRQLLDYRIIVVEQVCTHPILQRQLLFYRIIVVEQVYPQFDNTCQKSYIYDSGMNRIELVVAGLLWDKICSLSVENVFY